MERIVFLLIDKVLKYKEKISLKYWNWFLNLKIRNCKSHINAMEEGYSREYNAICNKICFRGYTILRISPLSDIKIGANFMINSGRNICINSCDTSKLVTFDYASLTIGDNTGISATTISVHNKVTIGNNVNIGSGTIIMDSDFHSLDPGIRVNKNSDTQNANSRSISIGDNVFIGARSIILKGTVIGDNSVIAAGSVVTGKVIPSNQIWGGNPAKFIREI